MDRPTCWDPPGQQGYPAYEQPSPFGWPTPPPTHMESLDRVFVEFRPQPPQLQRYQGETEEDRCYGDDFIHAHSPKLDESLDTYGCGYAHELGEQKEVDSSPSSLVVHIGYSCDTTGCFVRFSNRGMDANGHHPLSLAESRPWPLNPALQTAPPFLNQQPAAASDWHPPSLYSAPSNPEFSYDSPELIADVTDASKKPCPITAIDQLLDRDHVGAEGVFLDDEEKVGILTDSSPSPVYLKIQELCFWARSEALECMPTGPDYWATAYISDVNALMIYCPRRLRMLGILGVHKVDAGAINALATHRRVWTDIGSIDCRKVGETSVGNIDPPLTSWLSVVIVFIDCRKYCVFDPGGLSNEGAIMGIDEETFHLSGLALIDGVVFINQRAICASIKDMCLEIGSIGKVKKVAALFNDARVSSYDVVEGGSVKQGGVYLCAFLGDKIANDLPQDLTKIAFLYEDLYVRDVDSINHRSTSFDTDARLIPPHTDMLCLNIFGRVHELPVLVLHRSDPKSPSLVIFEGNNGGRCSTVRCAFDPGGDTSPKLRFLTLVVASWFPP